MKLRNGLIGMSNYFVQIVAVIKDYLGPAAERFVRRQIQFHLEKDPNDLTQRDGQKLADSIATALTVITKDKKMVDESSVRIHAIFNTN